MSRADGPFDFRGFVARLVRVEDGDRRTIAFAHAHIEDTRNVSIELGDRGFIIGRGGVSARPSYAGRSGHTRLPDAYLSYAHRHFLA